MILSVNFVEIMNKKKRIRDVKEMMKFKLNKNNNLTEESHKNSK